MKTQLTILVVFCCYPLTAFAQIAGTIYYNGPIITVNDQQPSAEAVAVKDGRILAKAPESVYMNETDYSPDFFSGKASDDAVYELRIFCELDCFAANSGVIEEIMQTFTVEAG